jgi:hypothetical protein
MIYLANAFSLNMLVEFPANIRIEEVDLREAAIIAPEATNVIGHADTTRVVGNILGLDLEENRVTIKVQPMDMMIVAQYTGPRLQAGATELPPGASLKFLKVMVE